VARSQRKKKGFSGLSMGNGESQYAMATPNCEGSIGLSRPGGRDGTQIVQNGKKKRAKKANTGKEPTTVGRKRGVCKFVVRKVREGDR